MGIRQEGISESYRTPSGQSIMKDAKLKGYKPPFRELYENVRNCVVCAFSKFKGRDISSKL